MLGTLPFGSVVDERTSRVLIDQALAGGIASFDVSHLYGDGKAMRLLSNAIRGVPETNIWCSIGLERVTDPKGVFSVRLSTMPGHEVVRMAESALDSLKQSRLSVLNIHGFDPDTSLDSTFEGIRHLKEMGLVENVSYSNLSKTQAEKILKKDREKLIDMVQLHGNVVERKLLQSVGAKFTRDGRQVACFRPFARGLFTREYSRANKRPSMSRSVRGWRLDSYLNEAFLKELESLKQELDRQEITATHFGLSWLLNEGPADCAVIGVRDESQLSSSLAWVRQAGLTPSHSEMENLVGPTLREMANNLPKDHFER